MFIHEMFFHLLCSLPSIAVQLFQNYKSSLLVLYHVSSKLLTLSKLGLQNRKIHVSDFPVRLTVTESH
jgi:hypothetical protein